MSDEKKNVGADAAAVETAGSIDGPKLSHAGSWNCFNGKHVSRFGDSTCECGAVGFYEADHAVVAPTSHVVPRHTPGPWIVHDQTDMKPPRVWVRRRDTFALARLMTGQQLGIHRDEVIANAHLIAAAPEMLEALKGSRCEYCGYMRRIPRDGIGCKVCEASIAVIAKAEGR